MLFSMLRLLVLLLCVIPIASIANTQAVPTTQARTQLVQAYGKLPLSFEANQGQTDKAVQFISRGSGYGLYLTPTEAVLALSKPISDDTKPTSKQKNPQEKRASSTVRMQLLGANTAPKTTGVDELPGKINYLRGNDAKQWRTNVATYGKVKYERVYPGIDLVYYGNQRQLEYDFVVAPGADPNNIQLSFVGQTDKEKLQPRINKDGALVVDDVEIKKPVLYQDIAGQRNTVDGQFVVNADKHVGFQVAAYDKSQPLVIDPVLVYSTFLGGADEDIGVGIAVDALGQAYVTGYTRSSNFPAASILQADFKSGNDDVFVSKLSADGRRLLYSTYLGGSGSDSAKGIAVDQQGQAYITGDTFSSDFPLVNALQAKYGGGGTWGGDVFISKISADGSRLLYSTYLGGTDIDNGQSIALDSQGQVYITGETHSPDFPLVNALQPNYGGGDYDAFISKLSTDGHCLLYSTYLGGAEIDKSQGIALDPQGQAYITGYTSSSDFPLAHPLQSNHAGLEDVFISKLSIDGRRLLYSTFLGGMDWDFGSSIAVDEQGHAYVTGNTWSFNFPLAHALQPKFGGGFSDIFISKLSVNGCCLLYSTYLGGTDFDNGGGIALDRQGQAYIVGETYSTDFPLANAFQSKYGGSIEDAFISKLSTDGAGIIYSSYLGGDYDEIGRAIAVDKAGQAYITGHTRSENFTLANPLQAKLGDIDDAFIAKIASSDYGLSVVRQGKEGVVSSQPNGITCGKIGNSVCTRFFSANTKVTLKATAGKNSVFVNWAGACPGSKALTCQVAMTGRKQVTAVFKAK